MKTRLWILPLATSAMLGACASQPTIDRWAEVRDLPGSAAPELHLTSAPAQPADGLSVKTLPDHAGAAFIAAVAAHEKSSKSLRTDVARPIKAPPPGVDDRTVMSRVVQISVERPQIRPGDRLLMTRVLVWLPSPNETFTDYQLAATDRSAVNIGSVSVTDAYTGTVGVAPGAAASANTLPSASLSASRTLGANRNITGEATFSVSVEPHVIRLFRTGAEDRDLLGATLVKLGVRLLPLDDAPIYWIADASVVDEDSGKPAAAEKATISLSPVALDHPHDVWACAKLDYEDREIYDGEKSADEGLQKVDIVLHNKAEYAPYLLIPAEEIETHLWEIRDPAGGALGFDDHIQVRKMEFDDYDSASALLGWLRRTRKADIKNGSIVENAGALSQPINDFDRLRVFRVQQRPMAVDVSALCAAYNK